MVSVAEQCRSCIVTLREVVSTLTKINRTDSCIKDSNINEQLERFSIFVGNIGALHTPESPLSVEARLREASDVLLHISSLLNALNDIASELLQITSGEREGMEADINIAEDNTNEDVSEVHELCTEMEETITQLFRISSLIRQTSPTDTFAKALNRTRYLFNDQFDIAHVGEKYPKLLNDDYAWLRRRLGRAIAQRRQYLTYIREHRQALDGMLEGFFDTEDGPVEEPQPHVNKTTLASRPGIFDTTSRPSYVTKATTIDPERISSHVVVAQDSDLEQDALSYTTISRSIDDGQETSTTVRVPKLDDLRISNKNEIECPFCYRIKKFKNERTWRRHVYSDLRSYVCTFPDCTVSYFEDINQWFQHEMRFHRVAFKCLICPSTVYHQEEKYLAHLRRVHPEVLEVGNHGLQPAIDLARVPLAHIPASDCPCCSDWVDRLRARAGGTSDAPSEEVIAVLPTIFKRHLASHLEQLALFAIPLSTGTDGDHDSNAAIEDEDTCGQKASDMSALTFASSRGDLTSVHTVAAGDSSLSKVIRHEMEPKAIEAESESAFSSEPSPGPSNFANCFLRVSGDHCHIDSSCCHGAKRACGDYPSASPRQLDLWNSSTAQGNGLANNFETRSEASSTATKRSASSMHENSFISDEILQAEIPFPSFLRKTRNGT